MGGGGLRIERLVDFVDKPSNSPDQMESTRNGFAAGVAKNVDQAAWPSADVVVFKDVQLRYRPDLSPVLKGLSFETREAENIGLVGRTGAGKSTVMLTLFSIVEISSGSMSIDGVDISKIGLKNLRSKIAIIPEDPVLFSGDVRSNLNPVLTRVLI
jgi:ABC-type multidrug transport system fused ATPase/permease subunit